MTEMEKRVCETCLKASTNVSLRLSDQNLCNRCEERRIKKKTKDKETLLSSNEQPEVSAKKLLETADSNALASQLSTGKDGELDQSEFENESDETREEIDLEDIESGGGDSDFEDEGEGNNVTVHENENGVEGETNDKEQDSKGTKQKDTLPEPTKEVKSALVKNKEECDKCTNRIGKGVRCTTCSKTWHWRCVGITKETTKQEVVIANIWHCHKCQGIDLKCILCKEKEKEIRGLKKSITELEKHLQTVNVALKDSTLEIMQIKEKLANEKRIRTILEKDIE